MPLCMENAISMTVFFFSVALNSRQMLYSFKIIVLKTNCAIYLFYPIKIFRLTFNSKQGYILPEERYLGIEPHSPIVPIVPIV